MEQVRPVSWLKGARKDFGAFPTDVQNEAGTALTIAARGGKVDAAKPLKGFESGIFQVALRHRGNAYRIVYAVQIDSDVWVIHAFQKKSKAGIRTPQEEIDLIRERLRRLKEMLR